MESSAESTGGHRLFGTMMAACLTLAFALALAPAASAARGVYDTFGTTGTQGGEFGPVAGSGISGVAVNSTDAGAANLGDVYVLDRGLNRIQRFDADGNFISAFGQDVVESGPGNTGTGYEICKATSGDVCKGGITGGSGGAMNTNSGNGRSGIAIDQTSGNLYLSDRANRRIQVFDGEGNFIRTFGKDVVSSGSEQADEQQRLAVDAGAGQYKLTFSAQTTADISFNAPAATVQVALESLASVGAGNVTVTGGPGNPGGTTPYLINFGGTLANTNLAAITTSTGTTPLSGGAATATIATFNDGAVGFEICNVAANCQGSPSNASTGGAFNAINLDSLAVGPAGAPNAGNVLVSDGNNNRVQEFAPSGAFVRTFGFDVVASGPGNTGSAFEICNAAALDICQAGVAGSGKGQFSQGPNRIAEDSSGNIYTVESNANFRVQRFALAGNVVTALGEFDPDELKGSGPWNTTSDTPIAVAVDTLTAPGTPGTVYVLKYFPPGSGAPPLENEEARILEVDPAGNGGEGKVIDTIAERAEIGSHGTEVTALALNSASGRLYVSDPPAPVYIIDEVPALAASLDPIEVGATSATLKATITPAPLPKLGTLYRFEYAKAGSGEWKKVPLEEVDIGNGAVPVAVAEKIEGLELNVCYDFRLDAHSDYRGSEALIESEFCTVPLAPEVKTGEARWSSPPASGPSLTLYGTINPGGDQTSYFFEYVSEEAFQASGFAAAKVAPALPAPAGHGLTSVEVLWSIAGLDSSKTYRYRLVASNSVGSEVGPEQSVAPPDPGARFYELVANADSNGIGIDKILAISENGERAMLTAQAMGDPHSLPSQVSPFLTRRGAAGWEVTQVNPDPESGRGGGFTATAWFPSDLSTALWSHYSPAEQIRGEIHWTFTDPDGSFRAALPTLVPVAGSGTVDTFFSLTGGAGDLSSFIFQREETTDPTKEVKALYVPGQPPTTGEPGDIYRVGGAGGPAPTLTLLNRDPAGNLISNSCGAWLGSKKFNSSPGVNAASKGMNLRPVSADGSVAYFSARPSGSTACNEATDKIRIFKRIGDTSTVEVSKSQCTRTLPTPCSSANGDDFFQGASANGNRAFFTSTRQLADSDEDATADLYLYDSDPPAGQPALVQASAGVVGAEHPKAGSGAEVLEGVLDIAVDGSRAYFAAKGQLAAGAVKGNNNLYVYQRDAAHPSGRIAFVAKLDSTDSALWGVGDKPAFALPFAGAEGKGAGDGHSLLFGSAAKLAAADIDLKSDLYRYDDTTAQLTCLTCAGNGNFGVSVSPHVIPNDPASAQRNRVASEDLSRVVFSTAEPLLGGAGEDENSVADAYEWHDGELNLISTGNEISAGVASPPLISPDGAAAFFLTADRILPSDHDSAADAYAARIGGGFPEAGEAQRCVSADECRTAPVSPPPTPAVGSTAPQAGNPPATRPGCPKGKVRKNGRCVKKPKKKHHRAHKRKANDERGGRR